MDVQSLLHYRILKLLGKGGMGEVYLAEDAKLGREVALKVLPESVSKHPERIQRFQTEARAIARLNHPNIAQIYAIEEAETSAIEFLEKVGLGGRIQHKPGELSGGERQRAAIARALVTRPYCILADEPTGNLDEHIAEQVFDVMLDLNLQFNMSLVMVTHNMKLAERFDTVQELHEGLLQDYRK